MADHHQINVRDLMFLEEGQSRAGSVHRIGYIDENLRTIGKLDQMTVGLNLPWRDINHGPARFLLPSGARNKIKQKQKHQQQANTHPRQPATDARKKSRVRMVHADDE
jgi:hypothetical protein